VTASAASEVGPGPLPGREHTRPQVFVLPPSVPRARPHRAGATLHERRADASAERQRSRRFRDQVLSAALGVPAHDLRFDIETGGRPRLVEPAGVDVSVTHAGRAVGVAIAAGPAIGIDLEPIRAELAATGRFRRAFSDAEWSTIHGAQDPDLELLRTWTQKEALLKALGLGLTVPLRDVLRGGARLAPSTLELRPPGDLDPLSRTWSVWSFAPLPGYVGACAVSAPVATSLPPRVRVCARRAAAALPALRTVPNPWVEVRRSTMRTGGRR
jgi:phosphopantetheinyl transferase